VTVLSTKTVVLPKLLWEKKLSRTLTSFVISKDGEKIAIADETGYLTLYNANGEKLWDYRYEGILPKRILEFKPDKSKSATALTDVVFSSSGKYMVFELTVLNTYKGCEGPPAGCQVYEPYKKFCFDSEGKMLWQSSQKGAHLIGGGEHVLINPFKCLSEDNDATSTYHLLDITGKVLLTGNVTGMCEEGGLSEDGKYLYMCDKLIDTKSGRTVWKLAEKDREFKGVFANYAVLSNTHGGNLNRYIYDITTRKQLLDLGRPQNISLIGDYVTWSKWKGGTTHLTVSEIKTGRVLHTFDKSDMGRIIGTTDKYILAASDESMQMYDIKGRKIWKTPVKIQRGDEHVLGVGYHSQKFKYFSVSKDSEFVLFGNHRTVKLYKSF